MSLSSPARIVFGLVTATFICWNCYSTTTAQDLPPAVNPDLLNEQAVEQEMSDGLTAGDLSTNGLFAPITALTIDIRTQQSVKIPDDRSVDLFARPANSWFDLPAPCLVYMWEAPNICYQPLYFEDIPLERYGQTCDPRRAVLRSATHFGISFLALPINMLRDPARSCNTSYGYCRPGDLVPRHQQQLIYSR